MAQTPSTISIETFIDSLPDGGPKKPVVVEFEPRHQGVNDTYQVIRQLNSSVDGIQYVRSSDLNTGHVVTDGSALENAIDSQSATNLNRGSWLAWPGHISGFHRDWNLSSALNFMFRGNKTWYFIDARHVLPRHANLIFGDTSGIERKIDAGKLGYKVIQADNQAIYLPGGCYHRVVTNEVSLSFSIWWTPLERLRQHRSITDTWWLRCLQNDKTLKREHAGVLKVTYDGRTLFDKLFTRFCYGQYLRLCERLNAAEISQFGRESQSVADRMRRLFVCETFDDAYHAAISCDH